MEELHGEFASINEINLAELGRRTGISRAKLRRLKANGFCETPHGLIGQPKEHLLDGYSSVLDNLLRNGVSNSTVCLGRLQAIGFSGSRSTVKRYIASHKHLIPAKRHVKLVRPAGDMMGLHGEFLPASKRYINDYIQYVKSDFLAGLGFGATQMLGENTGIYIGYSVDTGRNVYLQPSLASQGVKGTVTNALASAFVGSLGGGKSFCNNLLVYYAVLFGGQALLLDPKSERGNWKETLPEIAHEINIVNLTSDKDNAGLLDPFVIMKNVKDAESLAIDILTFLTGISSRDGEKFPVLRKAVRSVTQSDSRGLLHVIDELRREDTPISRNIADHIDSFTDYDFAHLLFSDGTVENAISLDNQLNIIQVADLSLIHIYLFSADAH